MVASLIFPNDEPADRFEAAKEIFSRAGGNVSKVGFDNATFLSERRCADRNMSLMYFMRENGAFEETNGKGLTEVELREHMDLYFQLCSIQINARLGAVMAATLANGGICPVTGERVFSRRATKDSLCLMYNCGMYD